MGRAFQSGCGVALTVGSLLAWNFYAGTTPATVPWTNGIVPYELTNALPATASDTSESSLAVLATNMPAPSAVFNGSYLALANGFIFTLVLATNCLYRIQPATNLAQTPILCGDLANLTATVISGTFTAHAATNYGIRCYRVMFAVIFNDRVPAAAGARTHLAISCRQKMSSKRQGTHGCSRFYVRKSQRPVIEHSSTRFPTSTPGFITGQFFWACNQNW